MMFITRWRAKRELKKAAKLIEILADTLHWSTLNQLFPNMESYEARNELHVVARRIRAGL